MSAVASCGIMDNNGAWPVQPSTLQFFLIPKNVTNVKGKLLRCRLSFDGENG